MKATCFHRGLCLAVLALAATAFHPRQSWGAADWDGRWTYEFYAGRNAANTGIVVDYTLSLNNGQCRLHAEGYQTDETIRCRAVPEGDSLRVSFVSYDDGNVANQYGVEIYKPGATLLTLARSGSKVVTTFGSYNLVDDKPHPAGVYFRRR